MADKLERTSLTGKKSDKKGSGEMKDFIVLTSLGPAAEYCGARLGVYDKGHKQTLVVMQIHEYADRQIIKTNQPSMLPCETPAA